MLTEFPLLTKLNIGRETSRLNQQDVAPSLSYTNSHQIQVCKYAKFRARLPGWIVQSG